MDVKPTMQGNFDSRILLSLVEFCLEIAISKSATSDDYNMFNSKHKLWLSPR